MPQTTNETLLSPIPRSINSGGLGSLLLAAGIGLALMTGLITGCTPQDEPAPPFPRVNWPEGKPSGGLELDSHVQAARTALEVIAVARNRNDFRMPELVATATYEERSFLSNQARNDFKANDRTDLLPGPQPFSPTSVEPGGKDRTLVRGCTTLNWETDTGSLPQEPGPSVGIILVISGSETSGLRLNNVISAPQADCSAATYSLGLFDPAPAPSAVKNPEDIAKALTDEQHDRP